MIKGKVIRKKERHRTTRINREESGIISGGDG